MSIPRILGFVVDASSQALPDNDVLYTVNGQGAIRLREICTEQKLNPSVFEKDGSFTIKKSDLEKSDTHIVRYIHEGLEGIVAAKSNIQIRA